ncbi:hypothetical protein GRS48_08500 [Halorubrum sp. JWXQ-INN 858]|uniref:hypothetical protein n=1 Tax=Halorubrum sp. JWXQ-INN 858 TaxID=2690782 RepID=UPI001357BBA1|nr:hypothetical protein [Halorubrum sp. JWXQ-INN 858]MWV64858.1 hypothetical protein [Halorubrum sp. JWXQ-INN 858]
MDTSPPRTRSLPFSVHVGSAEAIWNDASRAADPAHLVVTPVDLHQRNVEERLREADRPKSSLTFRRIRGLAEDLVGAAGRPASPLDRVDRLALIREVIDAAESGDVDDVDDGNDREHADDAGGTDGTDDADDADDANAVYGRLAAVIGDPVESHVETLERTRSELELVTGFDPDRMYGFASRLVDEDAGPGWKEDAGDTDAARDPAVTDTLALLAGVSRLHADLRTQLDAERRDGRGTRRGERPARAVSETSLLARATRAVAADPTVWGDAYPSIERLSIAGTSMLTAPLEDCCRVVGGRTDVDVHVHLRPASGPAIRDRLDPEPPTERPGTQGVFRWR